MKSINLANKPVAMKATAADINPGAMPNSVISNPVLSHQSVSPMTTVWNMNHPIIRVSL
jgi:hypothetical protein